MFQQLLLKGCLGAVICISGLGLVPPSTQAEETMTPSSSGTVIAQAISQPELEKFAKAISELRVIDDETRLKMIEAVQSNGMSPEEFMEIGKQEESERNLSEEQQVQFNKALEAVRNLNEEDRQKKRVAVEEAGLKISRFNEIAKIVEKDSDLQKKVVEILSR
ncbi:DUF4168 domain-containing protein [Crocosphaera sp. Alani8]|uniref:DUF4168 domain-containing protein n=1 Tax=Crocosphaera sp. Alani8 TaxID=3038952 RepID=UPI00313A9664